MVATQPFGHVSSRNYMDSLTETQYQPERHEDDDTPRLILTNSLTTPLYSKPNKQQPEHHQEAKQTWCSPPQELKSQYFQNTPQQHRSLPCQ